jgi:hypothetical protein
MKIISGEEIYAMLVTCAGLVVIWGSMVLLVVLMVLK